MIEIVAHQGWFKDTKPLSSAAHFAVVVVAEQVLLPALGVTKPTPSYGACALATGSGRSAQ